MQTPLPVRSGSFSRTTPPALRHRLFESSTTNSWLWYSSCFQCQGTILRWGDNRALICGVRSGHAGHLPCQTALAVFIVTTCNLLAIKWLPTTDEPANPLTCPRTFSPSFRYAARRDMSRLMPEPTTTKEERPREGLDPFSKGVFDIASQNETLRHSYTFQRSEP